MNFLEKPIYQLLKKEPFFANFLLGATLLFDMPNVGTAGCRILKGEVQFIFNTKFMESLVPNEQIAIIKHEIFHVLLDHCGTRGGGQSNMMVKNYAMDCAINQHIEGLPAGGVTLQTMEKLTGKSLLPFETWEYYYEQLKQAAKDKGEPHNHDVMHGAGDGKEGAGNPKGEELSAAQKAQNQAAVKDLANKAAKAAAGNVSQAISNILGTLNKGAKLNWKQQLRNIIASARSIKRKPTRMRANRRFELDMPGYKKKRELIVGVCTDSSGSVSDEAYMAFMTEIHTIAKQTTVTYLVHADCEVKKVEVIKGGKPKPGVLSERRGYGGTAYQPAIDECVKRKCDVIIYFGDFDCADKPENPGISFIWVGVGTQRAPGNFGKVLRLD